jgi:probable rRNA maturation factor
MPARINIENRNPEKRINRSEVERAAFIALKKVGVPQGGINIIFVTDRKIRALNKKYLGLDRATDVIAFPGEDHEGDRFPRGKAARNFLGDIAISSDRAEKNAAFYGATFTEELLRYVIHGILHLAGYKDASRREKRTMREKEDEILGERLKKVRK